MALPWFLSQSPNLDWFGTDTSGGFAPRQGEYIDTTTGKYVYEQDGKYWYTKPRPESGTISDDGQWIATPATPGVPVPKSLLESKPRSVEFIPGVGSAPVYGNLGMEVGKVDGELRYLMPGSKEAAIGNVGGDGANDFSSGSLGGYGGAQSAYWKSASKALGERVIGPDGATWIALPKDVQFGESDNADHSSVLKSFVSGYGPIVMAVAGGMIGAGSFGDILGSSADAVGAGLASTAEQTAITGALTDSVGAGLASVAEQTAINAASGPSFSDILTSAATSAGKNAAVQLVTTGTVDPEKALIAGVAGGAASVAPMIDTGLPAPVNAGLLSAGTTALAGGSAEQVLTGGVVGAGANLLNSTLVNDLGVPNAAANLVTSVGGAMAVGADPVAAGFGSVLNTLMSDKAIDSVTPAYTGTSVSTAPLVGVAVQKTLTDAVAPDAPADPTPAPVAEAARAQQYTFGSVLNPYTYTYNPAEWSTPPAFKT